MAAVEGDVNSEVSAALTASLEEFFHKALKDEQKKCIGRIVSLRCFSHSSNGIWQECYSDWLTLKA